MDSDDAEFDAAVERAERRRREEPFAVTARYDKRLNRIIVGLNNGLELMFPPGLAQGLERATPADLAAIEISPSGFGLHWPTLDGDLSVPGLLAGLFGSRDWMAGRGGSAGPARRRPKIERSHEDRPTGR